MNLNLVFFVIKKIELSKQEVEYNLFIHLFYFFLELLIIYSFGMWTFTHSPALTLPSYEFFLEFTGLDKDEN